MKRLISITTLSVISLITYSCKEKIVAVTNPTEKSTKDSTLLVAKEFPKYISIGEQLTPAPLVSQLFETGEQLYYIFLDGNDLNIFDYNTGLQKKRISINSSEEKGCGVLNNYSGFYYHSPDSIFIYNYKSKNLFLIDSLSAIKKTWNTVDHTLAKYPVDIEALTSSPISCIKGKILLSGTSLGQPEDATEDNKPVSCLINLQDGAVDYRVGYPNQYREGNFGGLYFNTVYHTVDSYNGKAIYSFPADHHVYSYDAGFSKKEKIYAGSRYVNEIQSSSDNFFELFQDKNKRIEYFISQPSYANILYDKYRRVYYRIATIPLLNWKPTDSKFEKPFSIITINESGKILSETPVFQNPQQYNLGNMHIAPEGLLVQKYTEDENIIHFEVFTII
ncbi:DUF4221 family protein [Parapedobacter koreensis]|uniref:DUF4221 domain-containing protein n=1 Tax=Parapedobacter koreensis TaxID=332977 RepID=A0A1H7F9N7_9SPHI|nr:DUF4221 family protein [Parapedobacter koreensis]SEK19915.1 protein of unknown function [Parapedobacter koreensis]